jgi:hypothetical protein
MTRPEGGFSSIFSKKKVDNEHSGSLSTKAFLIRNLDRWLRLYLGGKDLFHRQRISAAGYRIELSAAVSPYRV